MKKIIVCCLFLFFVTTSQAQKKLTPVTQSALTGIGLPKDSKLDNRMLSVAAAATLLEMESDKVNTKVQNTEVLVLPPVSINKFNKDSLVRRFVARNWKTIATEDNKFIWLQKDNRFVIAYFLTNTKQTDLYFADAASTPNFATPVNNASGNSVATLPVVQPETQPVAPPQQNSNTGQETKKQSTHTPAGKSAFTFTTSNFDDGWTSTVQEDWVHVVKGELTVLIHYPTSRIDVSSMDYKTISGNAWNTLVAPRYNSLNNFVLLSGTSDYEKPHFISADVADNMTNKKLYVALFKKGNSGWIEFITTDKNSFVREFGIDINKVDYYNTETAAWDPLKKMANYNKFAVAVTDLNGTWTSNFSGMTQYVNIYTGANAGATSHSSTESFQFKGTAYHWELAAASGVVGNLKFSGAKSDGTLSLPNNWQIHFSDLEGKPKLYNAYFSCIKGARILWLQDTGYGDYTGYGKKE